MHSAAGLFPRRKRGSPIRRPSDPRLRTAPRGISVFAPSFFGTWRLGIPRAPFLPYPTRLQMCGGWLRHLGRSFGHVPKSYAPSLVPFGSLPSLHLFGYGCRSALHRGVSSVAPSVTYLNRTLPLSLPSLPCDPGVSLPLMIRYLVVKEPPEASNEQARACPLILQN